MNTNTCHLFLGINTTTGAFMIFSVAGHKKVAPKLTQPVSVDEAREKVFKHTSEKNFFFQVEKIITTVVDVNESGLVTYHTLQT